jgi:hypothetical protein
MAKLGLFRFEGFERFESLKGLKGLRVPIPKHRDGMSQAPFESSIPKLRLLIEE